MPTIIVKAASTENLGGLFELLRNRLWRRHNRVEDFEIDNVASEILEARFLFGKLDSGALHPSPEDESWVEALPAGHLRETARRLRDMARLPGREGEVARRALLELYSAAREAGS